MPPSSYICSTCGKEHEGLPTDWGYKLPDEVHELDYLARYTRARSNADLCTLDEQRHFIRGVLPVPLVEAEDSFAWGVWVEVDRRTHDDYVRTFDDEEPGLALCAGRLANTIPGYSETRGLLVSLQFQGSNSRPIVTLAPEVAHGLAHEQREGISHKRHHDILQGLGFFGEAGA